MYLYNLTLQQATGIVCAINGSFSGGNKSQEIVVARGKVLELLRPDENGKIQTILSVDVFGAIRSLAHFRLTGAQKDYIVVGSDSGRIVILDYNKEKNVFDKIHQETFGKSGSRRIVPGQYLAIDPKGRAVMIGACEKQKLVYVLNRDTAARLTISSPLEAHKSHTITYSIAGVDCGFDNPIFAAIELDYSEADQDSTGQAANEAQKVLTFYELDLGLNHVSRKWSEQVDNGANMLVTVPGGGDGPSGVLVCAENFVIYKNQGHPDVRAVIPRRADLPAERGVLIVSATMHKQKSMFFFLLQTEYGDVFKVTLDHDNERVTELKIKYFDTIPVTSAMCVMKLGFLFGENGKMEIENGGDDEDKDDPLSDEQYGYPKAESDKWVSCIRVLDPKTTETTCLLELQDNEAAFSICTVNFHDKEYGTLLAVGTAKGLQFWPKRSLTAGYIHIYRFVKDGKSLELLHKTQVDGIPLALCQFQGRLLAGIGSILRLYDLGKRRLLRKCENKLFPNTINSIHTYRDRIYVGDIQESFHYCKYRRDENQLYVFADDSVPRWLTSAYHVDFDTMAGADKFGNIYFVRLPQDVSDEIEDDPTGGKIKWEQGKLNGAPNKVEEIVQFHVGDVVTCMQKASLIPGGTECVMYGTVMGSLGALLAFTSRDDVDFFSHLEMHMRQEHPPLCGRDHMAYRSAYFPVKDVIDGDLCEQYPTLPLDIQRKIADELDRTPAEILKKLEEVRNKIV
ncbi:putative transcription factor WD40-like family [Helianthus debilis subsp. tardiflorus]